MKAAILGFLAVFVISGFVGLTPAAANEEVPMSPAPQGTLGEPVRAALLLPGQLKSGAIKPKSDVIRICNDDYMACIPGVDTCCSTGKPCPADKKCP